MSKLHPLKVREVRRETDDTVSVAFDVPANLAEEFRFVPGQYLALDAEINGEQVRRSYSICASPSENDLRVAIKQVPEGVFSTYANKQLAAGDTVNVMAPVGNFKVEVAAANAKKYVAFAAGSGITPILSIAKTVLEEEPNSEVILFYGNKTFSSIIFREELEALKNKYMGRFSLYHVLSREDLGSDMLHGRITAEKAAHFASTIFKVEEVDGFYLCGPEEMILTVGDKMKELGADKDKVHFELFHSNKGAAKKEEVATETLSGDAQVKVIIDGDSFEFGLAEGGDSILDAALEKGADLPYACKGGMCCTCKAKVVEGEVEMEVNYALDDEEVADGYILACQCHPKSNRVVIDFDDR